MPADFWPTFTFQDAPGPDLSTARLVAFPTIVDLPRQRSWSRGERRSLVTLGTSGDDEQAWVIVTNGPRLALRSGCAACVAQNYDMPFPHAAWYVYLARTRKNRN